ncbi:hypothetical protein V8G54_031678 [Vigna mungo]|uniref:Reverse transcriptase RNase H-like domain-containing protein n=1 Tax=Vigna mungo TaxID=3915 RepID=A0AAQ3RI52_VIGMU
MSNRQLIRCIQTNSAFKLFTIQILPINESTPTKPPPDTTSLPLDITTLLRFDHLFQSTSSLPPSRPIDHHIHLLPNSTPALRGFLGLTGFYRKFVKRYAIIAFPFTTLLHFSIHFTIDTDMSDTTMGVVLMQRNQPIAFFCKPSSPKLLHSSTYVRELHAIISAVKKWCQYLLGYPFDINIDHKSLK